MFKEILTNVRETTPLVHCITNYVTVNDCANMLLACGGSPIMADDIEEVSEITSICGALCLNIGTLNHRTIASMLAAGKRAGELSHPIVLDPVGAGASALRTDTAVKLMQALPLSVIRGNISEIKALATGSGSARGVDADVADAVTEETLASAIEFAETLSRRTGAVIVITGAIDIVAGNEKVFIIRNGCPMMAKITGSGCMLTAVIAAFCGANPANTAEACALAVSLIGLAGEIACAKVEAENSGAASFRTYFIDAVSRMDYAALEGGMKIECR